MRVALLHDYLNQYGGAERVLEALMEIFPEAPIYTLLHDEEKTADRFRNRVKKTSFLNFPLARKHHRLFIPLMPLATRTITINHHYDIALSDTAGFAKGIKTHDGHCHPHCHRQIHISYIHTPLRYAWEQENYLSGLISHFTFLISKPILNWLRNWDYRTAQKPDILIANSQFIADKIKKYYNRDATVIYPPVDAEKFYFDPQSYILNPKSSYYLAVGRLLHYKKFDLIIDTFAKLDAPLKIVGSGPEYNNLKFKIKKLKLPNIELWPFINDESELRRLYNGAKALIFPQVEDFGLVAAEAQSCGTPVIAYAAGGALEIIKDGKTGLHFFEQTPESLADAVRKFEKIKFSRANIARSAQRFSKDNFKKMMYNQIQNLVRKM